MANTDLTGHRVLAITANHGVEQDELLTPVHRLRDLGAEAHVAAVSGDPVRTLVHDRDPGKTVDPDLTLAETDASAYDLLHIPGGTLNADALRLDDTAVGLVRAFLSTGRPVASICHGPWLLVEAAVVEGKTLTSYPSLRTDIRNAGGNWIDQSAVRDNAGGWPLITSRNPGDLDNYVAELTTALAETPARG
ncbi:type 1 glutamine amidotransferase domain-containing protein [Streptomyces sp. HNM0574]|uniref:type 1 glutamine amidotransferase domain-containing protein n=1 Tax=Streptomyces sp. HNM0574 TaxID=2714954 RepID=UPI00146EA20B|nr:type 1 glutamine amidotransferase domain-containing protein [Streptomyces sp. HNM0574]NLU68688.1 type 1 glutamine amidotransferase [Streptomyces sp. HNM0574]